MAKRRKQEEVRAVTRKETVLRRRDAERNRRVLLALLGVGALLVILLGAGVIQELVIKPRQPVATVNGQAISLSEYQKRVRFSWFQAGTELTDPQGDSLQVLDQMIDERLIREQAQQRSLAVSPEEVTENVEKAFGYFRYTPTPAPTLPPEPTPTPGGPPTATPAPTATPVTLDAYQKALKDWVDRSNRAAGITEADLRNLLETDLLRDKLYEVVANEVATTEEQVRARHILVRIIEPEPTPTPDPTGIPTPTPDPSATPTPAPRDAAQALARIIEVQQKLGAGEDFAKLALEYSDDTGSATEGGDLGWFGRGMMVTEFEEAAFSLQPGQLSNPVKTQFGYHLIRVEERDAARPVDEFTLAQRKYEAFNKWLADLRTAAKIERSWSLDKLPSTPGPVRR
jgi:parvulin-like peptidyl-prolyl isomerase